MKKQHRTNYTRQFKNKLVEDFRKSGIELPEFAAAHGIKLTTFKNWLYRPKPTPSPDDSVRMLRVDDEEPTAIDIFVGDRICVALPAGTEPQYVGSVVRELAQVEC